MLVPKRARVSVTVIAAPMNPQKYISGKDMAKPTIDTIAVVLRN